MTLTKHLYDVEECKAAFLWSLQQKDSSSAQFWLDELEESYIDPRALLLKAWLLHVGVTQCGWLLYFFASGHTRKGQRRAVLHLLRTPVRDASTWWLLCSLCVSHTPDMSQQSVEWLMRLSSPSDSFWEWCLETSKDERIDSLLESLQEPLGVDYISKVIALHMCIVQDELLTRPDVWDMPSDEPIRWRAKAYDEASFFGRTERIPVECLTGLTARGLGELCSSRQCLQERFSIELRRSPYWQRLLWKEGSEDTTPEAVDEFFTTHFGHSDIPDEWSREEQEKSHGDGVELPEEETLWSWSLRWIGSDVASVFLAPKSLEDLELQSQQVRIKEYGFVFSIFPRKLYRYGV